ncbi:MAG: VOC family protein [Cyanobacteriota bacterium]|nr:VOC family protein [Cyanobacteriota bacterium]
MAVACFHLSIPSTDLAATEWWYVEGLGCTVGRRSPQALILNLGGHQLVAQLTPPTAEPPQRGIYPRHFGLVFSSLTAWADLRDRAKRMELLFGVQPKLRYGGDVLEHHTFFLIDPNQHWLEFKHYSHPEAVFGCRERQTVGDQDLRKP